MSRQLQPRIKQLSQYVFVVTFMGTSYQLTLGGRTGMWERAQITYMGPRGEWVTCTDTQAKFITDVIHRHKPRAR